jgi:xanthine/uracil permease
MIAAVPAPVLGGAGIVMFGTVAASGIRTLARAPLDGRGAMVVAVTLGVGAVPVAIPDAFHAFPAGVRVFLDSGITLGSVAAVLVHAFLGEAPSPSERPDPTAPRPRA